MDEEIVYSPSINRNIVECKEQKKEATPIEYTGINRNIVECKVFRSGTSDTLAEVLIETLWNVKCNRCSIIGVLDLY